MHKARPGGPSRTASITPLNLRQIEVFHAIMVAGSLSEAGRMLCVSQPAVSRVLATIEARMRFVLFERVRGRLHPTPEARRLFAEVQPILDGVNRFNAVAASLAEHGEGKLSIVSSPSYSEWLMPRAIQRFRHRHPSVRVNYRPLPFDALLPYVAQGGADLCIASMAPPDGSQLRAREIGEGNIMCAVPRGHLLADFDELTVDDLRGSTFIGYGGDTPFGRLCAQFLTSERGTLAPDIEIRSTPEAMALVREGVGVALMESFGYTPDGAGDIVLKPIRPALVHKIYLVYPRQHTMSTLAKGFVATLTHLLEKRVS
ncbi:DNA-binding transcriptional LysR family regulator [Cupriavidus gilardii J11]|uniref:DNA-binding transcriptional LysR family regulator n=1 Tax=Cupriavidus gilardii J11 TaxID=936133 RepID=A0A562BTL3_9BURK|nr:LysR substrate-binding domain-containing protein [Cupriavidus gilardii]TWG88596.1 DNA-binding transcriptional LysR family regulator [Cupriavidus gilardii J11]